LISDLNKYPSVYKNAGSTSEVAMYYIHTLVPSTGISSDAWEKGNIPKIHRRLKVNN